MTPWIRRTVVGVLVVMIYTGISALRHPEKKEVGPVRDNLCTQQTPIVLMQHGHMEVTEEIRCAGRLYQLKMDPKNWEGAFHD